MLDPFSEVSQLLDEPVPFPFSMVELVVRIVGVGGGTIKVYSDMRICDEIVVSYSSMIHFILYDIFLKRVLCGKYMNQDE